MWSRTIAKKFGKAEEEVFALIEELDLVPAPLITPSLVRIVTNELRFAFFNEAFSAEQKEACTAYKLDAIKRSSNRFPWQKRQEITREIPNLFGDVY